MLKKITLSSLTLTFITIGLLFSSKAQAQMGMMGQPSGQTNQVTDEKHTEGLDEVLFDILAAQGKETVSEVDCDEITDDEFKRLGEAWMGFMHPDPEVHERMDQMMGGEGSETLRSAHINMGSRYLGCSIGKGGGIGMMTSRSGITGMGGMMGSNGNYSFSGLGSIFLLFWLTIWVLIVILLVVLIRYFWKKGNEKK